MKPKTKYSLVNNGQIEFGTFDSPIKNVNYLDARICKIKLPRFIKCQRLKEFQAFMGGDENYFFLAALVTTKITALAQIRVYDIKNNKQYVLEKKLFPFKIKTPNNILDSINSYKGKGVSICFENKLNENVIRVKLSVHNRTDFPNLSVDVTGDYTNFEHQVVSIPFSDKTGMYSHKGITRMQGFMFIDKEKIDFLPENSFFCTDDHKGFYPYHMKWDWLSSAFIKDKKLYGLTLTKNQSIDSDKFNENALWIDGKRHSLPSVKFKREQSVVSVTDKEGTIDLKFTTKVDHQVKVNVWPIIKINYNGPFGVLNGKIILSDKSEIVFDNTMAFSEQQYVRC